MLSAGLPVVTLPGHTQASRVAASLVASLGLANDLVASDFEGYVDKAIALQAPTHMQAVRDRLRAAVQRFSMLQFSGDWLKGLQMAWRLHVLSLPAAHIRVIAE